MEKITSAQIKDICSKRNEMQEFIEKHHPNKIVANRAINILNDNAMSHFRKNSAAKKKTNFFRKISCAQIINETI